jgi:hypothetical protein
VSPVHLDLAAAPDYDEPTAVVTAPSYREGVTRGALDSGVELSGEPVTVPRQPIGKFLTA